MERIALKHFERAVLNLNSTCGEIERQKPTTEAGLKR